ncbi:hypothetical protein GIB67_042560 [Kingdonia uniflora]|uniref:G-box binding protein multifunctional mosaic region domain-containing protein n=1 Tax=Kingdonia uniflora TaxID=39325 RepID=A0A7J7M152_9MAGN|nr:hypothetical protein GIB67_042560 [Kingdonia uniflora]
MLGLCCFRGRNVTVLECRERATFNHLQVPTSRHPLPIAAALFLFILADLLGSIILVKMDLAIQGVSYLDVSNIIYLNSPIGIELSYSDNEIDYMTGDLRTASESQGDTLLVEVQDANKVTQDRAKIKVSSLTDNPSDRVRWWPLYHDDHKCVGKVQLSIGNTIIYDEANPIKCAQVVETFAYDLVLESVMHAQHFHPRNLRIQGLSTQFCDFDSIHSQFRCKIIQFANEQPPPTTPGAVYPDWSQFQAYSPMPPHGFFHSGVASSPQAHPYMWGPQHLMPPYGTPPHPYVTMYPHGGLYGHPSMPPGPHPFSPYAMPSPSANPEASGTMPGGVEADAKSSDGKERSPLKRSKNSLGSLNMLTGKNSSEKVKTSGASANGVFSQSAESGSEGSSEGSDANSQSDSQQKASRGHSSLEGDASKNGNAEGSPQNGVSHGAQHAMPNQTMTIMAMPVVGAPPGGVTGPTTNLNIGMDYWGAPTSSAVPALQVKVPTAPVPGTVVPTGLVGSREGAQPELWIQVLLNL